MNKWITVGVVSVLWIAGVCASVDEECTSTVEHKPVVCPSIRAMQQQFNANRPPQPELHFSQQNISVGGGEAPPISGSSTTPIDTSTLPPCSLLAAIGGANPGVNCKN